MDIIFVLGFAAFLFNFCPGVKIRHRLGREQRQHLEGEHERVHLTTPTPRPHTVFARAAHDWDSNWRSQTSLWTATQTLRVHVGGVCVESTATK